VLGEQTYDCAVEVYSAGEESHARVNPTGKNLNGKKKENNRGRLLAGAACWRWDFSGQVNFRTQMLMYGKEASNRKQEIDRQHHTIPNQKNQRARPKDKHYGNVHNRLWNHG